MFHLKNYDLDIVNNQVLASLRKISAHIYFIFFLFKNIPQLFVYLLLVFLEGLDGR